MARATIREEDDEREWDNLDWAKYINDLAERLMHVPVMYGTDQYDSEQLADLARRLKKLSEKL